MSETDDGRVDVERDGALGIVTLNRPHRHNAITDEFFDAIVDGLGSVLDDTSIHAVLLRAEGRSFCSGRDTRQLGRRTPGESDFAFVRRHQEIRLRTLDAPKPVVAAVQGAAIGGGLELALSADFRVAADDTVLALPEIRYGLLPDTGGTQLVRELAGPSRAKYMVLSGERIDAVTALSWGLVDQVVPRDTLWERAREIAAQMAAHDPLALALGKQLVDHHAADRIRSGMRAELVAQTALFTSEGYLAAKNARTTPKEA